MLSSDLNETASAANELPPRRDAAVRSILPLVMAFFAFMVWFGAAFHPIEEVTSAERDNFVAKANAIRAGELPTDTYRPLLYPIVAAGGGELLTDTFAGARLISSIFAALLVLAAYWIGRACFSHSAGMLAATATMLNHNVIRMGVHATTDMMFAALAAWTLVAALRAATDPRISAVILVATGFAAAYFTRYAAMALLPAIGLALLAPAWPGFKPRAGVRVLVFIALSLVLLVPHFVLTYLKFGELSMNENWRNLAFKLYGNWDWTYLYDNPFHGTLSVIAHDPVVFLASAGRELGKFGFNTLIQLGGHALAGGIFAAATLADTYQTLFALDRRRIVLLTYFAGYVLAICAFFYSTPRFMLPVLPVCYALAGGWLVTALPGWILVRGRRVRRNAPVIAVFLLLTAVATLKEIPVFVAMHPIGELEAVRRLERDHGTGITVLGTAPYFQHHVALEYRDLEMSAKNARVGRDEAYAQLDSLVHDVDFVVVGRLTALGAPPGLVDGTETPAFLELIAANDDVAVYRVR